MPVKQLALVFVTILFIFVSCKKKPDTSLPVEDRDLAVGTKGMVSSAHPMATQAGLNVLKAGGNAFDAAVAIAATLNVVEPQNSGIGGYGTILVYDARSGKTRFLDSSGKIPQKVNSDVFRLPTPNHM
ncbi:MAG: gamma-glutamyltransferase, partial [Candidatus Aminicenantes bacterium]|nr:gamma-glutamyltransferase [Candidatus Aminicenantes bacterium]